MAEMKRRKHHAPRDPHMTTSNSSPDIQSVAAVDHNQQRVVLRPKTPPPPPPPPPPPQTMTLPKSHSNAVLSAQHTQQPPPIYASTVVVQVSWRFLTQIFDALYVCIVVQVHDEDPAPVISAGSSAPPAPPPPPPPELLRQPLAPKVSIASTSTSASTLSASNAAPAADCRGVSAEALLAVRLKPVSRSEVINNNDDNRLPGSSATSASSSGEFFEF